VEKYGALALLSLRLPTLKFQALCRRVLLERIYLIVCVSDINQPTSQVYSNQNY
jgi:hypothetical protein